MSWAFLKNRRLAKLIDDQQLAKSLATQVKHLSTLGLKDLTSQFSFLGDKPFANGVFSSIWLGRLSSGSLVALKLINPNLQAVQKNEIAIEKEAALWSRAMGHENVLPLLGFVAAMNSVGFVSPWLKEGNLAMYLFSHSEIDKVKILSDIARGLAHVHDKGIVYGMLRESTVMITDVGRAVLSSFLFASWAEDNQQPENEVLEKKSTYWIGEASGYSSNIARDNFQDDITAFGSLMMEVLPDSDNEKDTISNHIILNTLPEKTSTRDELWYLVQRCWIVTESSRPAITEINSTLDAIIAQNNNLSIEGSLSRPKLPLLKDISAEIKKLGEHPVSGGGYCDLYLGERLGKEKVALKLVRLFGCTDIDKDGARRRFLAEARIWAELDHPRILKFYGICDYGALSLFMVSPFLNNGNVLGYLGEINPNANRHQLLLDSAEGLLYLHSRSPPVIHGDLKGANILVSDSGRAVLADFGLAKINLESTMTNLRDAGSPRWMAPELFSFTDAGETPHKTMMSDIYAFGQVIVEVLSNLPPFFNMRENVHVIVQLAHQRRSPRPTGTIADKWITDAVWDYVQTCTAPDRLERPAISQLYSHLSQIFDQP